MAKNKKDIFGFLKSIFIFQDIVSWIKTKIPFVLEHNLAKYDAIKKAFYITALENLPGDYCEFGVFTGSSFVCAMRAHQKLENRGSINTTFYGFDSFTGFGNITEEDKHWFYLNDIFTINKKKVLKFIKKRAKKTKFKIIEGYFENTIENISCKDLGINELRIVFIDCDMKQPAKLSLNFVKNGLQQGTIIILDDFFSYKGSKERGVAGAFYEFCNQNKNIHFRELLNYGMGGKAFIVNKIE